MRSQLGQLLRPLLERVVEFLPTPRSIYDREGNDLYLSRYYLTRRPHMPDGSEPFGIDGSPKPLVKWPGGIGIYLHKFHRSDDDEALHNHPWKWAASFILSGGYFEERRVGNNVLSREVKPFSLNILKADTFHRVDLREEDCWSLFVTGQKELGWGFWNRDTGVYMGWREFIASVRENVRAANGSSNEKYKS